MDREYTVKALMASLGAEEPDAIVTLGIAPGPLATVTGTVNGYVILDAKRQGNAVKAQTAIREQQAKFAARTADTDTAYSYAHDAGLFGGTLQHVLTCIHRLERSEWAEDDSAAMEELRWIDTSITDALRAARSGQPNVS